MQIGHCQVKLDYFCLQSLLQLLIVSSSGLFIFDTAALLPIFIMLKLLQGLLSWEQLYTKGLLPHTNVRATNFSSFVIKQLVATYLNPLQSGFGLRAPEGIRLKREQKSDDLVSSARIRTHFFTDLNPKSLFENTQASVKSYFDCK